MIEEKKNEWNTSGWCPLSFIFLLSFETTLFFQSRNCILCLIVTLHFFSLILCVSVFLMCNSELRNSHRRAKKNRKSTRHYGSGKLAPVQNKWKSIHRECHASQKHLGFSYIYFFKLCRLNILQRSCFWSHTFLKITAFLEWSWGFQGSEGDLYVGLLSNSSSQLSTFKYSKFCIQLERNLGF